MPRPAALLIALAVVGCGSSSDTPQPRRAERFWPDRISYEHALRWDDRRGVLAGAGEISFTNTGPETLREVWLRTWPNAYGSCRRRLVSLTVTGARIARQRERCTAVALVLDDGVAAGKRATIGLRFAVRVPRRPDRFGRGPGVAYLGNALPTLAVADDDGWRIPPYADRGEAWFTLAADWEVRVDTDLAVAATGTRDGDVFTAKRARDFALVIGALTATERRMGDTLIRHHALPGAPAGDPQRALAAAAGALRAFERWYGPYGRRELDIVQGPARIAARGIAMEYPELVLSPSRGGAVTHEIAHQWWGMIMGNDPWREPWLDEAFAEYSQARLPASIGQGPGRLRGCRRPAERPSPPLTASMAAWQRTGGRGYVTGVYINGACVLRRLERAIGTERFDAMLQELVREHRDATWTTADLVAAVRAVEAPGFDPDAFLRSERLL